MKQWKKPYITFISSSDLTTMVKARAYSLDPQQQKIQDAQDLGSIYDDGNWNYNGTILLPDYGYEVQAKVLMGEYLKEDIPWALKLLGGCIAMVTIYMTTRPIYYRRCFNSAQKRYIWTRIL